MGSISSNTKVTTKQENNIKYIIKCLPSHCIIPEKVLEYYRKNISKLDGIIVSQEQQSTKAYYYLLCLQKSTSNNYRINIQKYQKYKNIQQNASIDLLKYNFQANIAIENICTRYPSEFIYIPSKPIPIPLPTQPVTI
jgi:hypothetical protein